MMKNKTLIINQIKKILNMNSIIKINKILCRMMSKMINKKMFTLIIIKKSNKI